MLAARASKASASPWRPSRASRGARLRMATTFSGSPLQGQAPAALGQLQVAVALVDHGQGVIGGDEAGIAQHGGAGPPVSFIEAVLQQRLDGAVVGEHGEDGGFVERIAAVAMHRFAGQEVDGEWRRRRPAGRPAPALPATG